MKEHVTRRFVLGLIALTCLVPFLFVRFPQHATAQTVTLYLSAISGYAGVALLIWMHVLGTRGLMKRWFRDMARLLKIHSWIGKYGTLLIFLHPIFIIMSYGESVLYIFVPHVGTQFDNRVTLGRISIYFLLVIWLTSAIIRGRIAERPWKYIHYLSYIILPFAILHIPDVGSTFITSVASKSFVVAIGLALIVTSLFRLYSMLNFDRLEYTVVNNTEINPGIFELTLRPVSMSIAPAFGQYVFIKLGLISEDHAFSVVYSKPADGTLVLTYKRFHMFTREMTKLNPGSVVTIDGPYGTFTADLSISDVPTVFVAGGIGITPFMSHLFKHSDGERWLFYVSPAAENAAYLPQLRTQLGGRVIGLFQTLPVDADFGEAAWVSADTFKKHLGDPTQYRYYLCGPPNMIEVATTSLRSLGVNKSSIKTEAFSF